MGLCSSTKTKDPLVDIERLLQDYVWKWSSNLNWLRRNFGRNRCIIDVNWNHIEITHELLEFKAKKVPDKKKKKKENKSISRDLCLFRTDFTNDTSTTQSYTFQTSRKTRSVATIQVEKGFRVGAKLDVKFGIPLVGQVSGGALDAFDVTGSLSSQFHVTKTEGETKEDELSWGVNSSVKVKPNRRTTASLMVEEKEFIAQFVVKHCIRVVRKAGVSVYVRSRRTNKIITVAEIPADCFTMVFDGNEAFTCSKDYPEVYCETIGRCNTVYGAGQTIHIKEEKERKKRKISDGELNEGDDIDDDDDDGGDDNGVEANSSSSSSDDDEDESDDEKNDDKETEDKSHEVQIEDITNTYETTTECESVPMLTLEK